MIVLHHDLDAITITVSGRHPSPRPCGQIVKKTYSITKRRVVSDNLCGQEADWSRCKQCEHYRCRNFSSQAQAATDISLLLERRLANDMKDIPWIMRGVKGSPDMSWAFTGPESWLSKNLVDLFVSEGIRYRITRCDLRVRLPFPAFLRVYSQRRVSPSLGYGYFRHDRETGTWRWETQYLGSRRTQTCRIYIHALKHGPRDDFGRRRSGDELPPYVSEIELHPRGDKRELADINGTYRLIMVAPFALGSLQRPIEPAIIGEGVMEVCLPTAMSSWSSYASEELQRQCVEMFSVPPPPLLQEEEEDESVQSNR